MEREVLPQLDAAGRASFALVGLACRDAARASENLAYAGRAVGVDLKVDNATSVATGRCRV